MRTSGFPNVLKALLVLVLAALMSGCAVVVGGVGLAYERQEEEKFLGAIEIGDIKKNGNVDARLINGAVISPAVFNRDMTAPQKTPDPSDIRVNAVVAEEIKRVLGVSSGSSTATIRVKTFYFDEERLGGYYGGYYYWDSKTEKDTLTYFQKVSVKKAVNIRFTVEQGNETILEVSGLWAGNRKADEIVGARQLAREVTSEVLKKLSASSTPLPASLVEAEADKK